MPMPGSRFHIYCIMSVLAVVCACAEPGQDDAVDRWVEQLGDAAFAVRQDAFGALEAHGIVDPEAVLGALPKSHPDPEIRRSCQTLREKLENKNWLRAVRMAGDDRAFRGAIDDLFNAPGQATMWAVVKAAGPEKEAAARIIASFLYPLEREIPGNAFLETREYILFKDVCDTLGQLKIPSTAAAIAPYLKGKHFHVRAEAASTLGKIGNKAFASHLLPLLAEAYVGSQAGWALVKLSDSSTFPQLGELLSSPSAEARLQAACILGTLNVAGYGEKIIGLLNDKEIDKECRWHMIAVLDVLCDKRFIPTFRAFLEDRDPLVRRGAAFVLVRLGDASADPHILRLLADRSAEVRRETADACGDPGLIRFAPQLIHLLRDKDPWVRGATCGALWGMGAQQAIPDIAGLLTDPDVRVRVSAAVAMARLSGQFTEEPIQGGVLCWTLDPYDPGTVEKARAWWEEHKNDPEFKRDLPR